jgi:energy-coupling factor transporter transmembrane protein EcfT
LKIRRDAVAVSSVLLTLALLIPMPAMLGNAWTVPQTRFDIAGRMGIQNYYAPIGFASLAIIVIGLIVTWAGYIKGVRWTWFVMFLIAWGWAFPVLVLAEFHWRNMLPIAQWPPLALKGRGPQLGFAEAVLTLLLMVLALVLPAKTFILGRGVAQTKPLTKP